MSTPSMYSLSRSLSWKSVYRISGTAMPSLLRRLVVAHSLSILILPWMAKFWVPSVQRASGAHLRSTQVGKRFSTALQSDTSPPESR